MTAYTIGGLIAALRPAGWVYLWGLPLYGIPAPAASHTWYDKPCRLHKTDFIDALKKLPPEARSAPYYVTEHAYKRGSYDVTARNVYVGISGVGRPNVVQDGDEE